MSVEAAEKPAQVADAIVENVLRVIGQDKEITDENSNKNPALIATQRDLIAGEVSKVMSRERVLPIRLMQAHDRGEIHIHDMDYFITPGMINCCLPDYKGMLCEGTVINGAEVSSPKTFQVACTVFTQIVAQIASNQYGGQSADRFPEILAPFLRRSRNRHREAIIREHKLVDIELSTDQIEAMADLRTRRELKDGIQTIQYQINTLMTTNGQAPFITLSLHFDPSGEFAKEAALITEEVLIQRFEGVKNASGVAVTPAFPKLIYVLDDYNIYPNSKFYYLTELAAKCTAKRMYPDYISAPKMRKTFRGQVFAPMGCRSFLSFFQRADGQPQFVGRFNKGVVTLNLPLVALDAGQDKEKFFTLLRDRLKLVKQALLLRQERVEMGTTSGSPIHWCHGALARLPLGEKIPSYYLEGGYSTLSIGYIGVAETCWALIGESNTSEEGKILAHQILDVINESKDEWNREHNYGFAVYGTPAESLTDKFGRLNRKYYGQIPHVTTSDYLTNSYHVHVTEPINVFDKFAFEAEFQPKSAGGCISYVELGHLPTVGGIVECIKYAYHTIMYSEYNLENADYCAKCDSHKPAKFDKDTGEWHCLNCGNYDRNSLYVVRRVCGYLGANRYSYGRSMDISQRVTHIGNNDMNALQDALIEIGG